MTSELTSFLVLVEAKFPAQTEALKSSLVSRLGVKRDVQFVVDANLDFFLSLQAQNLKLNDVASLLFELGFCSAKGARISTKTLQSAMARSRSKYDYISNLSTENCEPQTRPSRHAENQVKSAIKGPKIPTVQPTAADRSEIKPDAVNGSAMKAAETTGTIMQTTASTGSALQPHGETFVEMKEVERDVNKSAKTNKGGRLPLQPIQSGDFTSIAAWMLMKKEQDNDK